MQEQRVVDRIAVVAWAARGEVESEAGVESDGGGAVGTDFEDEFGCMLRARPIENRETEGATDAGAAEVGGDDDALQLGDAGWGSRVQKSDGKADELVSALGDEETAMGGSLPPIPQRTRSEWATQIEIENI